MPRANPPRARLRDYRLLCYLNTVRPALVLTLASLIVMHCGAAPQPDHQAEWRDVLRHKKAAAGPQAPLSAKQVYADALSAFVRKHPGHSRAREVYQTIQLDFANELASLGRYRDSIRFYRAILASDPRNPDAQQGLRLAMDRLAVSHDKLLAIEVGMSKKQVAHILGKPVPGWVEINERPAAKIEAWYYRTTGGGLAAVYFRDGEVFAAEEKSQARAGL